MAAVSNLTVGHLTSELLPSKTFGKHQPELLSWPYARRFGSLSRRSFFSLKSADRKSAQAVFMVLSTEEVDMQSKNEYLNRLARKFEKRFTPPHITDIFPIDPIPSTFCVNSSRVLPDPKLHDHSENLLKIFVHDDDRVLLKVIKYASPTSAGAECMDPDCNFINQWVCRAGPRARIYFHPDEVKAAIVTCGGLCPGLNDVIRQIVMTLEIYGVKDIRGIQYGYHGFFDDSLSDISLSRQLVQSIHLNGGSLLGVSRGGGSTNEIVDSLQVRAHDGCSLIFLLLSFHFE